MMPEVRAQAEASVRRYLPLWVGTQAGKDAADMLVAALAERDRENRRLEAQVEELAKDMIGLVRQRDALRAQRDALVEAVQRLGKRNIVNIYDSSKNSLYPEWIAVLKADYDAALAAKDKARAAGKGER